MTHYSYVRNVCVATKFDIASHAIIDGIVLLHKHLKAKKSATKKHKLRPIEKLMYVVSLAYPLTAVPQLIKVYSTHNVESLALSSWVLYVVFGMVFIAYAMSEKLRPLVIEGTLWVAIYVPMVVAIVIYA